MESLWPLKYINENQIRKISKSAFRAWKNNPNFLFQILIDNRNIYMYLESFKNEQRKVAIEKRQIPEEKQSSIHYLTKADVVKQ